MAYVSDRSVTCQVEIFMPRLNNAQVSVKKGLLTEKPGLRVRDRIMQAARELFYARGIHAVGVDAIVGAAGTNKMSFYRSFASKDELVAEYLRAEEREGWRFWDETVAARAGNPRAQVEALFDLLVANTCAQGARGCPLANA